MATVTITVPDALVEQVLAALRRRYPDLESAPAAEVGQRAAARMFREALMASELNRVEEELQQQLTEARQARQAAIAAALALIK